MRERVALSSILLLMAVVPLGGHPAESREPDPAEAILRSYADAFNNRRASDLARLYAEDAWLLPPGRSLIQGRKEIENYWRRLKAFERGGLRLPRLVSKDFGETTGYLVGYFSNGSFRWPDRRPVPDAKFVLCVKRAADGEWLITADIWNDADPSQILPAAIRQERLP